MNPQSLLFYLSSREGYRDVLISENEVFCGPQVEDRFLDSKAICLRTPMGSFKIDDVLARLSAGQRPELLVVKVDATACMVPRGLEVLKCPKVLVLGDSHHLSAPIQFLLNYARSERFDFILSDHDRHHLHWFKRDGFANVHWIPALNYRLDPRPVVAPQFEQALFVGQLGKHHIYRQKLFTALGASGVPLRTCLARPSQTADFYASHAVSLNCSLNGDLNLRVFEIMGSGGLLMTDRLSSDSGLGSLFADGVEFESYAGLEELRKKTLFYLNHQEEALELRRRGQARILAEHTPEIKRSQLMDLVFKGIEDPALKLSDRRFFNLSGLPCETVDADVELYEELQDMHRVAEELVICGDESIRGDLAFVEDLPRLRWGEASVAFEDGAAAGELGLPRRRLMGIDAAGVIETVKARMEGFIGDGVVIRNADSSIDLREFGYSPQGVSDQLHWLSDPVFVSTRWLQAGKRRAIVAMLEDWMGRTLDAGSCVSMGELAIEVGRGDLARHYWAAAVRQDRSSVDIYVSLSELEEGSGRTLDAFCFLREAWLLSGRSEALQSRYEAALERISDSAYDVSEYLSPMRRELRIQSRNSIRICLELTIADLISPYLSMAMALGEQLTQAGHEVFALWPTGDGFGHGCWMRQGGGRVSFERGEDCLTGEDVAAFIEKRSISVFSGGGVSKLASLPCVSAIATRLEWRQAGSLAIPLGLYYRMVLPSIDRLRVALYIENGDVADKAILEAFVHLRNAGIDFELVLGVEDLECGATRETLAFLDKNGLDGCSSGWLLDAPQSLAGVFARANVAIVGGTDVAAVGIAICMVHASGLAALVDRRFAGTLGLRDVHDCVGVDLGSSMEIAKALAGLLTKPELWHAMIENGRSLVARRSIARTVTELEREIMTMKVGI